MNFEDFIETFIVLVLYIIAILYTLTLFCIYGYLVFIIPSTLIKVLTYIIATPFVSVGILKSVKILSDKFIEKFESDK